MNKIFSRAIRTMGFLAIMSMMTSQQTLAESCCDKCDYQHISAVKNECRALYKDITSEPHKTCKDKKLKIWTECSSKCTTPCNKSKKHLR